jgi:uncharacterized protein DUF4279
VKIQQSAYFALRSPTLPADEIGARIGLPPDRIAVRGSRMRAPDQPAHHAREIHCEEPALRVDELIERVVARLAGHRTPIRQLVIDADDVTATLHVVRRFDDDDGEQEAFATRGDGLEKLPGQHQLLGWHLEHEIIKFLVDVGADVDIDEYG